MSWGPFSSEAELVDAWHGDYGPDWEAEAENVLAENGMEIVVPDDGEGEYDDEGNYEDTLDHNYAVEIGKLENKLGRQLTQKEVDALVADHGGSEQVADFLDSYDRVIGRDPDLKDDDDRRAVMAEAMDDDQAQKAAEGEPVMNHETGDYE